MLVVLIVNVAMRVSQQLMSVNVLVPFREV
jgi:hypothetical protein